jgi:hypothetical protein
MLIRMLQARKTRLSLAALAGSILVAQSTFAQSLYTGSEPHPVIPPPRPIYGQASQTPSPEETPRIAQTPQSPQIPITPPGGYPPGEAAAPVPMGKSGSYGGAMPAPPTMPPSFYENVQPGTEGALPPTAPTPGAAGTPSGFESALTPGFGGAGGGETAMIADNPGYIDSAIVRSRIRVRFDANYDDTSPDKAEFFYAKCGCFASPLTLKTNPSVWDRNARGPEHRLGTQGVSQFSGNPHLNYQELATYLEYAPIVHFSAFIEVPARFLQAALIRDTAGFSDVNMGFKYALVANPNQYYTFQFRTYAPTGAANLGLGTGHVSFEPALLVFQRLTDRLYFNGEFRDWIPVGGSNFEGNVLRYGLGLTYNIVLTDRFRVAPVNEVVGWTILNGKEFVQTPEMPLGVVQHVAGQSIANEKIGLRFGIGDYSAAGGGSALNDRHSLYVGYGRALTGDHWYKDTFRLEYNFWF